MKNVYLQKFVVDDTCVDLTETMPLHESVRLIERVVFNHSNLMGLDHPTMLKRDNAFWVISKLKLYLKHPIKVGDALTVKTWTHTPSLVRFKRDFSISKRGKTMLKGSSEWCCLDASSHKPRKATSIGYPELEMVCNKDVKTIYSNLQPELSAKNYVYTHTVRATDLDVNMHTNNLKYNYMVLNAFTAEEILNLSFSEYELYFMQESHEGDKIDIYKKKVRNMICVLGKCKETIIFKAVLKLKKC